MKIHLCGLLLATLFLFEVTQAREGVIRADDPRIDYVGRVAFQDDGSARFDWTGSTFRFRFSGNACAARLSDTKKSFYLVAVDDEAPREISVSGRDTLVLLAENLTAGQHTLTVYKRTEGSEGCATLHSIEFPAGGNLLPWEGSSARRIEYIGDSITCGFGSETADPGAQYCPETENGYHSYASIAARYFGADYTQIAHSGEGVIRNYGDKKRVSDRTMLQRFGKTLDCAEGPDWDFSRWQPHVVVICLGTNDFSTSYTFTEEEFIAGYRQLIDSVRKAYGPVPILCVSSPLASGDHLHDAIRRAVEQSNDGNLRFVPVLPSILDRRCDIGAGHPNYSGHRKIAMALIPYLSSATGWPCTTPFAE